MVKRAKMIRVESRPCCGKILSNNGRKQKREPLFLLYSRALSSTLTSVDWHFSFAAAFFQIVACCWRAFFFMRLKIHTLALQSHLLLVLNWWFGHHSWVSIEVNWKACCVSYVAAHNCLGYLLGMLDQAEGSILQGPLFRIANEQSTMPKWGPNGSSPWSVNNNVIEARKRRCAQWQVWPTAAEHTCGTTHFQNNSSRRSIMTRKLFRKHCETSLHRSFFWQLKRTSPSKVKNSSTAPPYIYVHKKELFSMHIKR